MQRLTGYRGAFVGASLAVLSFFGLAGILVAALAAQCQMSGGAAGRCVFASGAEMRFVADEGTNSATPAKGEAGKPLMTAARDLIPNRLDGTTRFAASTVVHREQAQPSVSDADVQDDSGPSVRRVRTISIPADSVMAGPFAARAVANTGTAQPASEQSETVALVEPRVDAIETATLAEPAPDAIETAALPDPMPEELETAALTGAESEEVAIVVPLERPVRLRSSFAVVGGAGVNVRAAPSSSGKKLFALEAGQRVSVISTEKGWRNIIDARGRKGWAYSSLLSEPTN